MAIDPTMQMEPQSQDVGFVNEPNAMPPQEGGEMSVADDISMEATAEDFILPYESVLLTGLNQLNRYAREAIDLASENNVNLTGTNIDPTDKVPIKISNYEYRIPKPLVAYFGGGKNYLDKIQQEGLDLRKRLQEEGQDPAVQPEEQELAQTSQQVPETPMMPQEAPMMPPQEGMPLPPMMKKGGFVLSKDQDAAMLEGDEAPTTQEQTRLKAQQPAMMTPDGKRVQQGFSAPAGYANGGDVMKGLGFKLEDVNRYNVGGMVKNAEDAVNMLSGIKNSFDREDKEMQRSQKKKGFA
jgi:hypothetical protein|tara:strand:- start:50 stop:937 length:888 start_codon:yes stop_codon:yes gene_type:complete